jgi:hypothetical protein
LTFGALSGHLSQMVKTLRCIIFRAILLLITAVAGAEDNADRYRALDEEVTRMRSDLSQYLLDCRSKLSSRQISGNEYALALDELRKARRQDFEVLGAKEQELRRLQTTLSPGSGSPAIPNDATTEEATQLRSLQELIEVEKRKLIEADEQSRKWITEKLSSVQSRRAVVLSGIASRRESADSHLVSGQAPDDPRQLKLADLHKELAKLLKQRNSSPENPRFRDQLFAIEEQIRKERDAIKCELELESVHENPEIQTE